MPGQWRKGMSVLEWLRARSLGRTADDVLDTEPIPVRLVEVTDSAAARQNLVNTSGQVTEANSSTISSQLTNILYTTRLAQVGHTTFGSPDTISTPGTLNAVSKWAFVACTEAGGSIAATEIVPALAGYTSHAEIYGIWCPAGTTDAANTWTFAITGGTLLGPAVWTMNITASLFHWFTAGAANIDGVPFPLRGTAAAAADDNKAMTVSAAGLAVVGTTYYILLKYWYET